VSVFNYHLLCFSFKMLSWRLWYYFSYQSLQYRRHF